MNAIASTALTKKLDALSSIGTRIYTISGKLFFTAKASGSHARWTAKLFKCYLNDLSYGRDVNYLSTKLFESAIN